MPVAYSRERTKINKAMPQLLPHSDLGVRDPRVVPALRVLRQNIYLSRSVGRAGSSTYRLVLAIGLIPKLPNSTFKL